MLGHTVKPCYNLKRPDETIVVNLNGYLLVFGGFNLANTAGFKFGNDFFEPLEITFFHPALKQYSLLGGRCGYSGLFTKKKVLIMVKQNPKFDSMAGKLGSYTFLCSYLFINAGKLLFVLCGKLGSSTR